VSIPLTITTGPDRGVAASPFGPAALGDAVVTASVALVAGDEHDLFGFYLRQAAPDRYLAMTISLGGRCLLIEKGAQVVARLDTLLNEGVPLDRAVGAVNRLAVVSAGPALVLYVNGAAVAPLFTDPSFADGVAGFYLRPGGVSTSCTLEVRSVERLPLPL